MGRQLTSLPKTGDVSLTFPDGEEPALAYGSLSARLIDGNLEGISFATGGVKSSQYVISELTRKFGPATTDARTLVRNGFALQTGQAAWILPDVVVHFDPAYLGDVTKGLVVIRSRRAADRDTDLLFKKIGRQRPL